MDSIQTLTVTVGSPVIIAADSRRSLIIPATVRATPGSGGTLLVEYRVSAEGAFVAWPAGTVSSVAIYVLTGPVQALRFTAATAHGMVEIAQ